MIYIVDIKMTNINLEHDFMSGDNIMDNLLDFEPINEIICKFRVKHKYYNLSLILTHTPNKKKIN